MTTDPTSTEDRAARLEALRQRRGATQPAPTADSDEPAAATAGRRPRTHRRHAATGGRILAGSLSAAAALGLMGAMAQAASPSTDAPTATVSDAAAPPVIVIRRSVRPTAVAAPASPRVTPTVAAPVTTSRGS